VHGELPEIEDVASVVGNCRWNGLFFAASAERVEALELAYCDAVVSDTNRVFYA
jgi:hypothetical protein